MKKVLFVPLMLSVLTFTICAQANSTQNPPQGEGMKIKISINDREVTATMFDNAAARDFVSLFPLTLTLKDYNRIEKVSDLPKRLSTVGSSSSYAPVIGDICYYSPWGNLCIFYKPFSNSSGLVLIGKIDGNGIEAFTVSDSLAVKFEVIP